jgi:hypothetical protein
LRSGKSTWRFGLFFKDKGLILLTNPQEFVFVKDLGFPAGVILNSFFIDKRSLLSDNGDRKK